MKNVSPQTVIISRFDIPLFVCEFHYDAISIL